VLREFKTLDIDTLKIRVERWGMLDHEEEAEESRGVMKARLEISRGRVASDGGSLYGSRIVDQDDLTGFIDEGWEYLGSLNGGKYLS
jgi:hypothetical protein